MRTLLIGAVLATLCASAFSQVRVDGHLRRDGAYVAPHYRSAPNHTPFDNYSTRGNVNPYTGQSGTVQPQFRTQTNPYSPNFGACTYAPPRQYRNPYAPR